MIKKRIYKIEQDDLDFIKDYYRKFSGVGITNQGMVKIAVKKLVETIKREKDEK